MKGKHSKTNKDIKKQKKYNFIYIIVLLIFITLFIISTKEIVKWYINNQNNKKIQEEISQEIIIDEKENKEEDKYKVNFKALKDKNPDTVGWLKVNGTKIEHTIVQANDNDYYLTHNFEKEYNSAGWIFADYKNKFDGTDKNIVIYGHNMRDNSMFGSLKDVIKEKWYNNEENYKIIFITENEPSIYEVFSVYQIENEDYYIQTNFRNNTIFEEFINTIKSRSVKNFEIEVTKEDTILTLSTCANDNRYRVVLHAKKIN